MLWSNAAIAALIVVILVLSVVLVRVWVGAKVQGLQAANAQLDHNGRQLATELQSRTSALLALAVAKKPNKSDKIRIPKSKVAEVPNWGLSVADDDGALVLTLNRIQNDEPAPANGNRKR